MTNAIRAVSAGLYIYLQGTSTAVAEPVEPEARDTERISASSGRVQRHFEDGKQALAQGRFWVARREFRSIVKLEPHWNGAKFNLGLVMEAQGRLSQAKKLYDASLPPDRGKEYSRIEKRIIELDERPRASRRGAYITLCIISLSFAATTIAASATGIAIVHREKTWIEENPSNASRAQHLQNLQLWRQIGLSSIGTGVVSLATVIPGLYILGSARRSIRYGY